MTTNAAAVFGDYENFTKSNEVHLGNPHYYPSDIIELDDDAKRTSLNPKYVDLPHRYEHKAYVIVGSEGSSKMSDVLPESRDRFISKIESSGSSKYNESWPATEQSLASSNRQDEQTLSLDQGAVKSKEHSIEDYLEKFNNERDKNGTMDQWNSGTLSRFVQRFREQPPLPRTQRSTKNSDTDFWWLSSPPAPAPQLLSSTPKSLNPPVDYSPSSNSLFSPDLSKSSSLFTVRGKDKEVSSTTTTLSPLEESESDVVRMQMRTNKLLNLTDSQLHNQRTISSLQSPQENVLPKHKQDCLPVHVDPSQRIVPPPFKSGYDYSGRTEGVPAPVLAQKPNLRPEDDILYKWRLSRKMNLAAQSASERNDPFLSMNKGEGQASDLRFSKKANASQSDITLREKQETHPSGAPSETAADGINKFTHHRFSDPPITCTQPCCLKELNHLTTNVLDSGSCGCNRGLHHHTPPHTHDESDIFPCVNQNDCDIQQSNPVYKEMHPQKNKFHSQNNKDISSGNHTENVSHEDRGKGKNKPTCPSTPSIETLETTEDVSGDSRSNVTQHLPTDAIAPVINQVVGAHLFDIDTTMNTSNDTLDAHDITLGTAEDSVDMSQITLGMPNGYVRTHDKNSIDIESSHSQISHMVDADDFSDGEFPDDEILREMRCRRLRNRQELKLVCERLQIIQETK